MTATFALLNKTIGKILRAQPELADVHQHVERALRFHRSDVRNLGDAIKHVVAAHVEFLAHVGERLLIAFERGERALCANEHGMRSAVALNRIDRLGHRFRRSQITEPPASHRVGFAETVDRDREIVSFLRKRRDADVFGVVVNQLLVNFVRQNVDVFLGRDFDDRFHFFAGVNRAGRIVRADSGSASSCAASSRFQNPSRAFSSRCAPSSER